MSTKKLQVFGLKGEKGTGIKSITQTTVATEDKGKNVVNIALDDGSSYNVEIQNGSKGSIDNIDTTLSVEGVAAESKTTGNKFYELERDKSPAIVQKVSGETIVAKDSSNNPLHGLKLFGKTEQVQTNGYQLFDASKLPTHSAGGATVTNNGDGSFTVSGSGALGGTFGFNKSLTHDETIELLKNRNLHLYCGAKTYPYFYVQLRNSNGACLDLSNLDNVGQTKEVLEEVLKDESLFMRYGFYGLSGANVVTGTIKPMLYQDGDGTWEPFTGGEPSPSVNYPQELESKGAESGKIESSVRGCQLFNASKLPTKSAGGATVTNNGDGSFTVSGSGELTEKFTLFYNLNPSIVKSGTIHVSTGGFKALTYFYFMLLDSSLKPLVHVYSTGSDVTGTITNELLSKATYARFGIYGAKGTTITTGTFKPMAYQDGDGTWEPYKHQSHITTVSSGLAGLPLGATIPDVIANSEAHMSGVYWDEKEKQYYIGDTVDEESGKRVQRVESVVFDGSEDEAWQYYVNATATMINQFYLYYDGVLHSISNCVVACSHFIGDILRSRESKYGIVYTHDGGFGINISPDLATTIEEWRALLMEKPITIKYILATPIETDLTAEEVTAYQALHSNYPTTTIMNDCDAHMEVEYVADTSNYITQNYVPLSKYNELEERILSLETAIASTV